MKKSVSEMSLPEMQRRAYQNSRQKGFWDDGYNMYVFATKLCLIHSEVTEMLEALRKEAEEEQDNLGEEAADVAIRLMDFCEANGIDLENEILKKMEKNEGREHKHGKAF